MCLISHTKTSKKLRMVSGIKVFGQALLTKTLKVFHVNTIGGVDFEVERVYAVERQLLASAASH